MLQDFVTSHPVEMRLAVTYFTVLAVAIFFKGITLDASGNPQSRKSIFYLAAPLLSLNAVALIWELYTLIGLNPLRIVAPISFQNWAITHALPMVLFWIALFSLFSEFERTQDSTSPWSAYEGWLRGAATIALGTFSYIVVGIFIIANSRGL